MSPKHLVWIIPLCLLIGWFICYELQSGTSMMGWELSKLCLEKLNESERFTQCQEECLYTTRAESYENCYWNCKKT